MGDDPQKSVGIFLIDFLSRLSKHKIEVLDVELIPEIKILSDESGVIELTKTGNMKITIRYRET